MAQIITIPEGIVPYYINLDLNGDTVDERVWSQQYDTETRYIVATIWNNGIIYPLTIGHTIHFVCTKPKTGFGINNEAGIDTQGRIVYIVTDQTTTENGRFKAEFRIYDSLTGKVGTPNFNMYVEKSALSNDTIISTPEVNILTALILDATEAIANMSGLIGTTNTAITNANSAATNATSKATLANTATTNANTATGLANTATTNSNTKATLADQKATLANTAATSANTAATNANDKAAIANTAATSANTKATLADTAATNATNIANQLTQETLKIYKPSVATFTNIATTYPTPLNGWAVVTRDTGYEYRYNGSAWLNIGVSTAIDTATNATIGLVKGGKNVDIEADGALVADVIKDKATSLIGISITCPTSDDALIEITNITNVGVGFTLTSTNGTLIETLVVPYPYPALPIYIKSFKGTTTITTTATTKPTLTANFKSELWARDYLQDVALKSKFDATSQIAFTEASTDINITSGETIPTSFGKLLKSIKTFRTNISTISTNIGTLSSLATTVKTSLVNAINELVTKINELVINKINVSDIVNNDTTGGTNKVASAETVKVLGQEVDALNNNLGDKIVLNTEYKTNDLRDGKPVYTKYLAGIASTGQNDVSNGIGYADTIWVDSANSFFYDTVALAHYPSVAVLGSTSLMMWANRVNLVYFNTTTNTTYYHAVIRYTKTTD